MPQLPSLYQIKPAFQRLLSPVLDFCLTHGISANALTALALALSALGGAAILFSDAALWALLLYPPLMLVRMALNALDGLVARRTGTSTRGGMIFNEAADILSDLVMYLPLLIVPTINPSLLIGFVVTGVFAELAGLLRLIRNGQRAYHGPLGKSDRAAAVVVLTVMVSFGTPPGWLSGALGLFIALHLVTIINRSVARLTPPPGA